MLLLVCLFFVACSYASENTPFLTVTVENDSPLLQKTKERYYEHGQEYWESKHIYFYNLAADRVQPFEPNDRITNLFSTIDNVQLAAITQLPEIQSMFQTHSLYPDLPNKFDLLFKSIDILNFSENQTLRKQIIYHFKLFFYNIASNKNPSIKAISFNDFLISTEKCTLSCYDINYQADKKTTIGINACATILLGGAGIGLSVGLPNGGSVFLPVFGSPLLCTYLITAKFCWNEYCAYKNFLKTIDSLKQKNSQD